MAKICEEAIAQNLSTILLLYKKYPSTAQNSVNRPSSKLEPLNYWTRQR